MIEFDISRVIARKNIFEVLGEQTKTEMYP